MKPPGFDRPGPWRGLLEAALVLTDHLETVIHEPFWTFGGGTVLMLRLGHRHSKDIDLFVPDPQYLGHVSPRLNDIAEALADKYIEAAEFTKIMAGPGEIDFVVGTPLTDAPWDWATYEHRRLRVESCAEIIAKKMHYRGHRAKARDLFDLCAVAELEPKAIAQARPWFGERGSQFLAGLHDHADIAEAEFTRIDRLAYSRNFGECLELAARVLA